MAVNREREWYPSCSFHSSAIFASLRHFCRSSTSSVFAYSFEVVIVILRRPVIFQLCWFLEPPRYYSSYSSARTRRAARALLPAVVAI